MHDEKRPSGMWQYARLDELRAYVAADPDVQQNLSVGEDDAAARIDHLFEAVCGRVSAEALPPGAQAGIALNAECSRGGHGLFYDPTGLNDALEDEALSAVEDESAFALLEDLRVLAESLLGFAVDEGGHGDGREDGGEYDDGNVDLGEERFVETAPPGDWRGYAKLGAVRFGEKGGTVDVEVEIDGGEGEEDRVLSARFHGEAARALAAIGSGFGFQGHPIAVRIGSGGAGLAFALAGDAGADPAEISLD